MFLAFSLKEVKVPFPADTTGKETSVNPNAFIRSIFILSVDCMQKMLQSIVLFSFLLAIALFLWSRYLLASLYDAQPQRNCIHPDLQSKVRKFSPLTCKLDDEQNATIVFHVEETLLKSSSLFPYFLLVAFEAGGLLRSIVLLLLYPLACLLSSEVKIKILVCICFLGIKKDKFRIGKSVLPKFFLEDVGCEVFEEIITYQRKVAISDLPTVVVEGFLKDYLGIDVVIGRELKVGFGYFVGLMEERQNIWPILNEVNGQEKIKTLVGINSLCSSFAQELFSHSKEIHLVSTAEKSNWSILPNDKYLKKLIFHDGRLAFRPTYHATLIMLLWMPFGLILSIVRVLAAFSLPPKLALPILSFTGGRMTVSNSITPANEVETSNGTVYVCNHRTLIDPVSVSLLLMRPVTAVSYSISRVSALISPIRTIPLMRNREKDFVTMKEELCQGDLVVFPEGTTCREPYLLRFSPLFAELSENIVLVALDMHTSMFYGTTASGLKCLDPFYFLMNPSPVYVVRVLERLPKSYTCSGGKSRIEVANYVQTEIAKALGYECTSLTRKDKYMLLAGTEGIA